MKRLLLVLAVALAVAPAGAQAKPRKVTAGQLTVAFDNAFGLKVVGLGIAPLALAPAVQDGVAFTMPVVAGTIASRGAVARSRGGFNLTDAPQGIELALTGLIARVRGRRLTLQGFAFLGGKPYDSFVFASGKARRVQRTRSGLVVSGVVLSLTRLGSTALNSQFLTQVFEPGVPIGAARLSAGTAVR